MKFEFRKTEIPDVMEMYGKRHHDYRGFFQQLYDVSDFSVIFSVIFNRQAEFVQDNFSYSKQKVFRGLHYQANPKPTGKLVTCLYGEIEDFALDIRKDSPTFGKNVCIFLTSAEQKSVWIPPGFAHGFYVMSEAALVFYKLTNAYDPALDRAINAKSLCLEDFALQTRRSIKDLTAPCLEDIPKEDLF